VLTIGLAGCSASSAADESEPADVTTLRLGFFPNLTHAPALVGLQEGLFKSELKEADVTVTPTAFNAGPDAVTAIFGGSIDIAYIGPNPTINAYVESGGDAIRVISGAASGGAALVVRPGIDEPADLKGRTFATPQLGNTQDVAFRYWLQQQDLSADTEGGGDVSITPQSNGEGLTAYGAGEIDGAWVPQPWVAEYQAKGATVLVDEAALWPQGQFVTTNIVVRTEFLEQNPEIVAAFLRGNEAALQAIADDPAGSQEAVINALSTLTGSTPKAGIVAAAWPGITFTDDPLPATLAESAQHAIDVGLLEEGGVQEVGGFDGLYDLGPLNALRTAAGKPAIGTP
jgi:NitT/TauT family transport system substrate-binding protein